MAKQAKPNLVAKEITILDLVKNVTEEPPPIYANFSQFLISNNELFMDFYYISPGPGGSEVRASFVQRVILPHSLAKGVVEGLTHVILAHEADTGRELPNARDPQPSDKINVWTKLSAE